VKISNKKFSFFSTRNQYLPHIPYVASKKREKTSIWLEKQKKKPIAFVAITITRSVSPLIIKQNQKMGRKSVIRKFSFRQKFQPKTVA
jgi:hypothetical protein